LGCFSRQSAAAAAADDDDDDDDDDGVWCLPQVTELRPRMTEMTPKHSADVLAGLASLNYPFHLDNNANTPQL
jgi:hypothetical protein